MCTYSARVHEQRTCSVFIFIKCYTEYERTLFWLKSVWKFNDASQNNLANKRKQHSKAAVIKKINYEK